MTLVSTVVSKMNLSSKGVYVCGILCLVAILLCHLVLYMIQRKLVEAVNVISVCTFVFLYGFCWITDQTFIVVTLGKFVPSTVQSSAEGIRLLLHLC